MELGELWKIAIGTVLSLFVLVGLFRFKGALRHRLFPTTEGKGRGEAMAELLMLSARLQGQGQGEDSPGGETAVGLGEDSWGGETVVGGGLGAEVPGGEREGEGGEAVDEVSGSGPGIDR